MIKTVDTGDRISTIDLSDSNEKEIKSFGNTLKPSQIINHK